MYGKVLLAGLVLCLMVAGAEARTPYVTDDELQGEVRRGVEQILDLWRDGRYGELYEHTAANGKQTKEQFGRLVASAPLRPACCWEKIQEVKISLKGDSAATVRATLGFEGGGETQFKTKAFKVVKEDGVWRMTQGEILSLAAAKKKGRKSRRSH